MMVYYILIGIILFLLLLSIVLGLFQRKLDHQVDALPASKIESISSASQDDTIEII